MNIFTIFQQTQSFFFDLSAKFQTFKYLLYDYNPLAWLLLIAGVISIGNHCGGEIHKAAGMYLDMYLDKRTGAYSDRYDSFRANAVNFMKIMKDPQLRKFFEKDTCDLSFPQNDLSVFITISPEKQEGTEAYQRIIFGIIVEQQYINKDPTMLPLLIILDEFAAIGSFEMLKRAVVIARSACMRFLFILQNREQLDEHYGKDGAKSFFCKRNTMFVCSRFS